MSALSPQQIASVLRSAGFADQEIPEMTAIALAESGGRPNAHNPNAATGDNSYGLWQINMLGGMGPERLREFGISSNEQLFDPLTNARAAKRIRDSQGFGAWSVYKSGAYRQFLDQARRAATEPSVAVPTAPLAGGSLESGQPPRPRDDGDIFAGFAQRLLAGLTPGATGALAAPRALARPAPPAAPATGFRKAGGLPEELIAQIALGSDASERALALAAPPPVVTGGTPRRMAGSETFQAQAETLGFSPARYMAGVLSGLFESRRQPTQAPPAIPPTAVPSAASGRPAKGDVIEYLTGDKSHWGYDASHDGDNYHEHLAFTSKERRDAAIAALKAEGIQIGSVNDGRHAPNSYHYSDMAFDVPASQVPVGQERALSRRVREILVRGGFTGL